MSPEFDHKLIDGIQVIFIIRLQKYSLQMLTINRKRHGLEETLME